MPRRRSEPLLFKDLFSPEAPFEIERELAEKGFFSVAGVDEAGRGPLAGPVVASAVILNPDLEYPGVQDSKKIRPDLREKIFRLILNRARAVGLGLCTALEVDRHNVLQASLMAMARAVANLTRTPDFLIIDGNATIASEVPQRALVKGDARCLSVGAASIVAKVVRDRMMQAFALRFPGYGFENHKGYATAFHLEALAGLGPSPIHRLSFARVLQDSSHSKP